MKVHTNVAFITIITRLTKENITMTYTHPNGTVWSVGFDAVFDRLETLNKQTASYPPHNVVKHDDDNYEIAIAVAGFSQEDLSIESQDGVLTIQSKDVDLNGDVQYIHKGIATRKFKKQFTLGEYIEVDTAALVDGILSVYLKRELPEEKKPKTISIGSKKEFLSE